MPVLTIPNTFSPATTAQSAQVNGNFSAIATLLNSTLLDSTNIQASAITTSLIAANAVTGAKLNSNVVDGTTLQYSASQLSIATGGVGTTQLAAGSVTQAKRAALGQQISSSCGIYSTSSTAYATATNLSVSITTTGRPVYIGLVSDSTGTGPSVVGAESSSGTPSDPTAFFKFRETSVGTDLAFYEIVCGGEDGRDNFFVLPPGSFWHIYQPSAGTYTYAFQAKANTGGTSVAYAEYCKLIVYEL